MPAVGICRQCMREVGGITLCMICLVHLLVFVIVRSQKALQHATCLPYSFCALAVGSSMGCCRVGSWYPLQLGLLQLRRLLQCLSAFVALHRVLCTLLLVRLRAEVCIRCRMLVQLSAVYVAQQLRVGCCCHCHCHPFLTCTPFCETRQQVTAFVN